MYYMYYRISHGPPYLLIKMCTINFDCQLNRLKRRYIRMTKINQNDKNLPAALLIGDETLPVLRRGEADLLFKDLAEVVRLVVRKLTGDVYHRHIRVLKHIFRDLDPPVGDIDDKISPHRLFKNLTEIAGAHVDMLGRRIEGDAVLDVELYI